MSTINAEQPGIDPCAIPCKVLSNGQKIPAIGMGTFGSDRFSAEQVSNAVLEAAAAGFRFFDCASVYGNEKLIGEVFKKIIGGGIPRQALYIDSKVWNDRHQDVLGSCRQTLEDLQLDYLDLYLVHWPFSNYHPPGCSVDSRSPDARPYSHERFMSTWRQMEQLVKSGLVKSIGTSNMTIPKMELLLADAEIAPVVNEMECHPHFQQPELYRYLVENGIQPIGFCPIGSPTRPDRDKTADDTCDIEDPVIVDIARRLGVHPAVVCIKWAVQRGQIPIPFSVKSAEIRSNLLAVTRDPLTDDEMRAIAAIDRHCRLIKGQVFLWEHAAGWEDLWDLDGSIAG
ncbi:aldo/keto reductase [Sodalis ligni]|uniref:Diketogulonate reductase-like aldo/keto reductase n=2 Tax=Sodalis ligni TaxID=2697027 RepID=A0A4R1NHX8_9GAMM|nr:aldo/keto reductase [Sodalis ligni]TCL04346.1 diketogulonate reductase-like aldo/keto reductase [Sodalis ligni]